MLQTRKSENPLFEPSLNGDADKVNQLLNAGADPCILNDKGESPLSAAIEGQHKETVRLLVDHGALAANDRVEVPFLVLVPLMGDLELFQYLVENGRGYVNISDCDSQGRTAFHSAIQNGHEKMLQYIISCGYDLNQVFLESAKRGDYYYSKSAVEYGTGLIDINAVDPLGNTALHYAASANHRRIASFLCKAGARRDIRNRIGQVAMELTVDQKIRDIIQEGAPE